MIEYRIEYAVTDKTLTEFAAAGWKLAHVLHAYESVPTRMNVLLSKTQPDNLSGLMIDVDKPKPAKPAAPRRGRPPKNTRSAA